MTTEPTITVKLFFCYAREDKALRDELEQHLSLLKNQKLITIWHDREITPGSEWEKEIDTHLNSAHIILLLVSRNFLASDYCYGIEMKRAIERHEEGTARVIPIVLRPVNCEDAPFSSLQMLPTNAKPITRWKDRDLAYSGIAEDIRKVTIEILAKQWRDQADSWRAQKEYEQAKAAYEQAIRLNPIDIFSYDLKGKVLVKLHRFEEAAAAYEQALTAIDEAINLDPLKAEYHYDRGRLLIQLEESKEFRAKYDVNIILDPKNNKEVLAAFNEAIRLDPMKAEYHYDRGKILVQLKRSKEALAAFDQAISLDPTNYKYNSTKGDLLETLKKYEKDLAVVDEAISLDHEKTQSHYTKSSLLVQLGRYEEALTALDQAKSLKVYEEKIEIYENLIRQTRDEMGKLIQQTRDEMEKHSNQLFEDMDIPLEDFPF